MVIKMKIGILALVLILLVLSAAKLAFPETIGSISEALSPLEDYTEALVEDAVAIGRRLSGWQEPVYASGDGELGLKEPQEIVAVMPGELFIFEGEGFVLEEMIYSNLSGIIERPQNKFIPPESVPEAAGFAAVSEQELEAEASLLGAMQIQLDDFLVRQAATTAMAVPDSVLTEPLILDFEYSSPLETEFTSAFGYRVHPIYGDIRFHYGTDFPAVSGTPILAFADGNVIAAQVFGGYGQSVLIDHGNGFTSFYAHCSALNVVLGDTVSRGQTVALVGATGNVTGPHLHFELQVDGKYLNPELYL